MLKTIISVGDEQCYDEVAKSDADRCAEALRRHWHNFTFRVNKVAKAKFEVQVDVSELSPCFEFKLFAQGFLASAHLWER
jgi:hypothetical protein